jgi:uncharacterized protein (TIGR02145 family)
MNFKQEDLAKELGVNQQNISLWEAGKGKPSYSVLKKLFEIGATVEELFSIEYSQKLIETGQGIKIMSESKLDKLKRVIEAKLEANIEHSINSIEAFIDDKIQRTSQEQSMLDEEQSLIFNEKMGFDEDKLNETGSLSKKSFKEYVKERDKGKALTLDELWQEYLEVKINTDGNFTDPRDGRRYRTVLIGKQIWMAQNLKFNYFGSKCYKDKPETIEEYGWFYDWETAKKAVPPGWHLPSYEEWETLINFVGGIYLDSETVTVWDIAGKKLKSKYAWESYGNTGNTDDYGFAILPNGFLDINENSMYGNRKGAYLWTSTESKSGNLAYYVEIELKDYIAMLPRDKEEFLPIRCIKD